FTKPWPRQAFEQELRTPFARLWLLVDTTVGGATVGFADFWLVEDELHLLSIAIHPDRQGNGLGRWLLDRIEEEGRESGAAMALLEVRASNAAAQALYRGRGYGHVGMRRRYYSDTGEDALVLLKFLGGEA
ncbi:MAG: ribosomal protein S18-alanine N-acetyltransferase, partial [Myxococcota bacterium]|nr:ribosomal protein S18-alanine N-acetyltransferase [Myxococcota bacterium]